MTSELTTKTYSNRPINELIPPLNSIEVEDADLINGLNMVFRALVVAPFDFDDPIYREAFNRSLDYTMSMSTQASSLSANWSNEGSSKDRIIYGAHPFELISQMIRNGVPRSMDYFTDKHGILEKDGKRRLVQQLTADALRAIEAASAYCDINLIYKCIELDDGLARLQSQFEGLVWKQYNESVDLHLTAVREHREQNFFARMFSGNTQKLKERGESLDALRMQGMQILQTNAEKHQEDWAPEIAKRGFAAVVEACVSYIELVNVSLSNTYLGKNKGFINRDYVPYNGLNSKPSPAAILLRTNRNFDHTGLRFLYKPLQLTDFTKMNDPTQA